MKQTLGTPIDIPSTRLSKNYENSRSFDEQKKKRNRASMIQSDVSLKRKSATPEAVPKLMKIPSSGKVNSLRIGKSKKNHHIFGRPLEKLLELQGDSSGIPFIVQDTVSWLRSHALEEEGLFRVGGNSEDISNLKELYKDELTRVDFNLFEITSPHSVAGLLKQYIRELPQPILTTRFYSLFLQIEKKFENSQKFSYFNILVHCLPEHNFNLLIYLLKFLNSIARNSKENKMTSSNLATCWAPTLLWSESVSIDQMTYDSQYGHSILQALIESFDQILIPPSISPSTRARLMIDKKCGWINFKDKAGRWKKRWITLSDMSLFNYKDPRDIEPKNKVLLLHCLISIFEDPTKPYTFKIEKVGDTILYFAADTLDERDKWIRAIYEASIIPQVGVAEEKLLSPEEELQFDQMRIYRGRSRQLDPESIHAVQLILNETSSHHSGLVTRSKSHDNLLRGLANGSQEVQVTDLFRLFLKKEEEKLKGLSRNEPVEEKKEKFSSSRSPSSSKLPPASEPVLDGPGSMINKKSSSEPNLKTSEEHSQEFLEDESEIEIEKALATYKDKTSDSEDNSSPSQETNFPISSSFSTIGFNIPQSKNSQTQPTEEQPAENKSNQNSIVMQRREMFLRHPTEQFSVKKKNQIDEESKNSPQGILKSYSFQVQKPRSAVLFDKIKTLQKEVESNLGLTLSTAESTFPSSKDTEDSRTDNPYLSPSPTPFISPITMTDSSSNSAPSVDSTVEQLKQQLKLQSEYIEKFNELLMESSEMIRILENRIPPIARPEPVEKRTLGKEVSERIKKLSQVVTQSPTSDKATRRRSLQSESQNSRSPSSSPPKNSQRSRTSSKLRETSNHFSNRSSTSSPETV